MSHTFESAYKRLQDIHKQLSTQDIIDIDTLLALQKEAKELHTYLQDRLSTLSDDTTKSSS